MSGMWFSLVQIATILSAYGNAAEIFFPRRTYIPDSVITTNWSNCKHWWNILDCSGKGSSDIPLLNGSINVVVLLLNNNKMTRLPTLPPWTMSGLKEVYLSHNQLHTIENSLEQLGSLQRLNISDNPLTKVGRLPTGITRLTINNARINNLTDVFQGQVFPHLVTLSLNSNQLETLHGIDWNRVLPKLDWLDIRGNKFVNLDGLRSTSLYTLLVGNMGLRMENLTIFAHLRELQVSGMCTDKKLSFNEATSLTILIIKDVSGIETIELPPKIATVSLANLPQARTIAKPPLSLESLTVVKCRNFAMRYDGVWPSFQNKTRLTFNEVDIRKAFLNTQSIISTNQYPSFRHILELKFYFTNIAGIKDYGFQNLINVETVGLSNNQIRHVQSSAFYIPNQSLYYLDLSYNQIETIEPLLHIQNTLRVLNLYGNRIKTFSSGFVHIPHPVYLDIASNRLTDVQIINDINSTHAEIVASFNPWHCPNPSDMATNLSLSVICDTNFKQSPHSCICQRYMNSVSSNETNKYMGTNVQCSISFTDGQNLEIRYVSITVAAFILATIVLAVIVASVVRQKQTKRENTPLQPTAENSLEEEETKGVTPPKKTLEPRAYVDIPCVKADINASEYEGGYIVKPAGQAIPEKDSESFSYRNSTLSQHKDVAVEYPANVYEKIPTSSAYHGKNDVSIPEVDYTSHHEYSTVNVQLCSELAPRAYVNRLCCAEATYVNEEQNS